MIHLVKCTSTPIVWILLLLVLGLVLSKLPRKRTAAKAGWLCTLFATLLLYMLSIEPVANWIVYPLESKYAAPSSEAIAELDVVAVLGGGSYPSGYGKPYYELTDDGYARVLTGITVFRQSHAKTIVFCGTKAMRPVALQLGVPESEILEERDSSNTMENAARLAEILPFGENRRIGLVTSAVHLSRAECAFRACFPRDVIVPIPANYLRVSEGGVKTIIPSAAHFERSTRALHEWIGILWYAVRY
jgi:uncharacterized SAM-binding protein YcdF (DUF218 family)